MQPELVSFLLGILSLFAAWAAGAGIGRLIIWLAVRIVRRARASAVIRSHF